MPPDQTPAGALGLALTLTVVLALMARALQPGSIQILSWALVALLLLPQQQQLTRPGNHHHRHDFRAYLLLPLLRWR